MLNTVEHRVSTVVTEAKVNRKRTKHTPNIYCIYQKYSNSKMSNSSPHPWALVITPHISSTKIPKFSNIYTCITISMIA